MPFNWDDYDRVAGRGPAPRQPGQGSTSATRGNPPPATTAPPPASTTQPETYVDPNGWQWTRATPQSPWKGPNNQTLPIGTNPTGWVQTPANTQPGQTPTPGYGADQQRRDQIKAVYSTYLHRAPSEAEIAQWVGNPDFENQIRNSPEGRTVSGGLSTTAPPPSAGGANVPLPQFTAGMTPDQVRAAITKYYQDRGVTPNPTSVDYWVSKWSEFGQKDPAYFGQRLSTADEFTGGGGYAAPGFGDLTQMDRAQFGGINLPDDPGYQFRLSEGLKGIERSAAARGTLLTGGTLKALGQYHQGLASQDFGDAWQRAMNTFQTNYGVRRGERSDLASRYEMGLKYGLQS
jgi:hypothetical protein